MVMLLARVLKKVAQQGRNVRLYMYSEQISWLAKASRLSGYSRSEIVRLALEEFRKKVSLPGVEKGDVNND